MQAESAKTGSLRERAYASFTESLLAQDIAPGQFVSQRELVEITGMPLGAIREMLPRLEADGLIKTVPKRGLQVAHVDLNLIRNAFQLRQMLEREAVISFCATAPDAEIAQMKADHSEVREQAGQGVTPALLEHAQRMDWDFHDRMIDALGNTLVSDIYRVNSIKVRLIRQTDTRMLPELVIAVMDEHLKIIDALVARDTVEATDAIAAHIGSAKSRALGV
jgi:DNA-binding GntR family transcriptional regulator